MRRLILYSFGVCLPIFACKSNTELPASTHEIDPLANAEAGDVEVLTDVGQIPGTNDSHPSQQIPDGNPDDEQEPHPTYPNDPSNATTPTPSTNDQVPSGNDTMVDPTTDSTSEPTPPQPDNSLQQLCVDTINNYRKTLGLTPYERWKEGEACTTSQTQEDYEIYKDSGGTKFHGSFPACSESAQNECPEWYGVTFAEMTTKCLKKMWDEGPGEPFSAHGHYINMSSTAYKKVACGYYETPEGKLWSIQNFAN